MKNIVITGSITATSKKQDSRFKQENPTKTAYIECDEHNSKLLEDFGLTRYTSKETGNDFFIIKLSSNLCFYSDASDKQTYIRDLAGTDSVNFNTGVEPIKMNIIQGENMGNEFFRVQALMLPNGLDHIEVVEASNPFA